MLPCVLAFQSPSSEGHDENSNLEFIAEVRGCSETQRHSPMFIPTSREGRGGERRRTCPSVWLGIGLLESYSHLPGLRVRYGRKGNYASPSFPGRLERLWWPRMMEGMRPSILSKESSRGLRRVS